MKMVLAIAGGACFLATGFTFDMVPWWVSLVVFLIGVACWDRVLRWQ